MARVAPGGDLVVAGRAFHGTDTDLYVARYAQADGAPQWTDTRDSGNPEQATDLALDGQGDVYGVGRAFSAATANAIYAARLDGATGGLVWSDTHTAVAVVVAPSGDVFVAGDRFDTLAGHAGATRVKYAPTGHAVWTRRVDGAAHDDRAVGIALTPGNQMVLDGWSDGWTEGATDYDLLALRARGRIGPALPGSPTDPSVRHYRTRLLGLMVSPRHGRRSARS